MTRKGKGNVDPAETKGKMSPYNELEERVRKTMRETPDAAGKWAIVWPDDPGQAIDEVTGEQISRARYVIGTKSRK